jgi:predicted transcriptional regulator
MTTRTLIVTVESLGDVRRRSDSALERALSGDVPDEDAPRRLSFETTDQLTSVFSARAIDLLQTIAREGPESMREAARLVDRDIKQVSKNLERLAEYGGCHRTSSTPKSRVNAEVDEFSDPAR